MAFKRTRRNICCQRIGKFSVSMAFSVLAREDLYASLTKRSAPISEQWRPERCNQAQANCSSFHRKFPRQLVRNVSMKFSTKLFRGETSKRMTFGRKLTRTLTIITTFSKSKSFSSLQLLSLLWGRDKGLKFKERGKIEGMNKRMLWNSMIKWITGNHDFARVSFLQGKS